MKYKRLTTYWRETTDGKYRIEKCPVSGTYTVYNNEKREYEKHIISELRGMKRSFLTLKEAKMFVESLY